jgi:fluoride ion exporter CrcB/FEX
MLELTPILLSCCFGYLLGMAALGFAGRRLKEAEGGLVRLKLAVSAVCCFAIGTFCGQFDRVIESDAAQLCLLLTLGFLAGFNPPYQAANDIKPMLREGRYLSALLSTAGSLALFIFAGFAGFALASLF